MSDTKNIKLLIHNDMIKISRHKLAIVKITQQSVLHVMKTTTNLDNSIWLQRFLPLHDHCASAHRPSTYVHRWTARNCSNVHKYSLWCKT